MKNLSTVALGIEDDRGEGSSVTYRYAIWVLKGLEEGRVVLVPPLHSSVLVPLLRFSWPGMFVIIARKRQ